MEIVKLTIKEVTGLKNGYDMPIVKVLSPVNLKVDNGGYNNYTCQQSIDESNLLELRKLLKGEKYAHLEIETPNRVTCCWYLLNGRYETNNIEW